MTEETWKAGRAFIPNKTLLLKRRHWISLAVQWLRLQVSTAGGMGLIPGWGTKILHAMQMMKKIKKAEKLRHSQIKKKKKKKLSEFITTRFVLKEMLKEILQTEMKGCQQYEVI